MVHISFRVHRQHLLSSFLSLTTPHVFIYVIYLLYFVVCTLHLPWHIIPYYFLLPPFFFVIPTILIMPTPTLLVLTCLSLIHPYINYSCILYLLIHIVLFLSPFIFCVLLYIIYIPLHLYLYHLLILWILLLLFLKQCTLYSSNNVLIY